MKIFLGSVMLFASSLVVAGPGSSFFKSRARVYFYEACVMTNQIGAYGYSWISLSVKRTPASSVLKFYGQAPTGSPQAKELQVYASENCKAIYHTTTHSSSEL